MSFSTKILNSNNFNIYTIIYFTCNVIKICKIKKYSFKNKYENQLIIPFYYLNMQVYNTNERVSLTQRDKILAMIANEDVKQKVLEKLIDDGIKNPSLKLEIIDSTVEEFTMEELDVLKVFE